MSLPLLPDALLDALDGSAPTHLVHIGGGDGSALAAVLARSPQATGALVDLPEVVAAAGPTLEAAGVADRADVVAVGPHDPIPPGGDVYVLAPGSTAEVEPLLGRCRAAMAVTARLAACVPAGAPDGERLAALVEGGGFTVERIDETDHGWRVVLARPSPD